MAKTKYFSLRLSQSLADRIERAKAHFGGGISMGEAARRLMERGLDQIDRELPGALGSLQERPREALLAILGKQRDDMPLTQAEWRFLAESAHRTYKAACGHLDVIARKLLADHFRAFTEVIRLQKHQYGESRDTKSDCDYMSRFGRYEADIEASAASALAALPVFPTSRVARDGSLNLYHALAGQPLDVTALHLHLAPYLEALTRVACRGYWMANETSVFDDPARPQGYTPLSLQRFPNVKNRLFEFSPFGFERELMARLQLRAFGCTLDLPSYVELTEFTTLVWAAAQADEEVGTIRSDPFRISWWADCGRGLRTYGVTDERVRLTFSPHQMKALGDLLREAVSTPEMRDHMERLALVYGCI